MIQIHILIVGSIITAILCLVAAWQWRGRMVPIGWRVFLMMGLGSLAIGAFYVANLAGEDMVTLIPFSRILWGFILLNTALIAVSALIVRDK
jgi:hypothetical protein